MMNKELTLVGVMGAVRITWEVRNLFTQNVLDKIYEVCIKEKDIRENSEELRKLVVEAVEDNYKYFSYVQSDDLKKFLSLVGVDVDTWLSTSTSRIVKAINEIDYINSIVMK